MSKYIEATEILLSFLFPLSTKQPILDAVNMRKGLRGTDVLNLVHSNYESRLLQALKR